MTQSASMSALWHPAIRVDWLVLQRMGPGAFARILGAPALLLACCVALACGDFFAGYRWCLAAGALLALGGSHAIVNDRLLGALERWRWGWCGALPVARGATALTLMLVTTAALAVSLAAVTASLVSVSMVAPHRGDLAYALVGIDLALVVGVAVATVRVFRRGGLALQHANGIREPLFALSWLNDPRLPHLLDWQRRAALFRWRRGGASALGVVVLAGVPDGAAIPRVVGLVLLVLSWSWLAVVMRASADAAAAAAHLLGAVPLDGHRAWLVSLRYPIVAMSCALVLLAVGTMLGARGVIVLAWAVCACASSVVPLVRMRRATRSPGSSR